MQLIMAKRKDLEFIPAMQGGLGIDLARSISPL
jgi:hypothetical protein